MRTLAGAMDDEIAAKKKRDASLTPKKPKSLTESRFFAADPSSSIPNHHHDEPVAGPSRLSPYSAEMEKENIPVSDEEFDFAMIEPENPVVQENGYISPSASLLRLNTPELSSPLRPGVIRKRDLVDDFDDFDVDPLSSPVAHRIAPPLRPPGLIGRLEYSKKEVLARDTPPLDPRDDVRHGPDLRDMFNDDHISDIDCFDDDALDPTPPITSNESAHIEAETSLELEDADAAIVRAEIVAQGWWEKWGRAGKDKEGRLQVFHVPSSR